MRHFKVLLSATFLISILVLASTTAMAQYTLNVDYCSNGCLFGGTGGTVTLTQISPNDVQVSVSLATVDFHGANNPPNGLQSFVFNLGPGVTGSVSIVSDTAGFVALTGPIHEDGAGTFDYGVNCTNCGPQNGGLTTATLTFDVVDGQGITIADFASLSMGGSPSAYFAASVFSTSNSTCTGVIGSNGSSTPTTGGSNTGAGACSGTVPEPTSLAMLAWSGLIGLVPLVRRKLRV